MNNLKRGIYLIIFCLPLYLIRLKIFRIPTTVLELSIYALFVLWLVNKGYKGLWTALKHERLLIWGILLLFLGVSIATVFSWDIRLSAGIWKAWFVDPILFFVVFITVIKKEDIKNVFKCLVFSGAVVAVIALVYLACGNLNYQGRLQGIFNSPNYLAMYLAPILIILMFLFKKIQSQKGTRQRPSEALRSVSASPLTMRLGLREVFLAIEFLTILVVLFFTKSFGVLLGIIITMGFGVVVYLYNKHKKGLLLGIIFAMFALIMIIGWAKMSSLEGLRSFDARFVIWEKAIDVFVQYPFTGIGPGTFESYFPPYPKWGVPQPHNVFLAFLIQTGLVGLVGFILILIWFYKNNAKNLALLCLMTYILAHGLVDTTYWKNDLSMMFWIIIGIATVLQFYRVKQPISLVNEE
ncbi:MAG: O-antigen ligase family protein [Candidatus Portnoybacteria bacterium]|nr:O-antigen ligase family protein [Candidatus Portnoybacteria bacterium]